MQSKVAMVVIVLVGVSMSYTCAQESDSTMLDNDIYVGLFEQDPTFPGSYAGFYEYLDRKIKCSRQGKKVYVHFVLDSTGYVRKGSVFINESVSKKCADQIKKAFEESPQWEPGVSFDKKEKVNVKLLLPINL
ncbi:hypothetical protein LVD17_07145 [Fulvivirga ulvae]|uniref:hypothetical protein n=1 Tax=Fulvivirga ulvae TaxID=2904245 RepID=UPI001F383579|nr:hypothetical protein [Fulvivirga ulvae]UII33593.1 hypothetical protein LVD17_07145 [Fulvivirga ulvae]